MGRRDSKAKQSRKTHLYLYLNMAADSKYPENNNCSRSQSVAVVQYISPFIVFSCLENLLQADFTVVLTQRTLLRRALGAFQG